MNTNQDGYPKFNKSLEDYRKLSYHSEKHYDYQQQYFVPNRALGRERVNTKPSILTLLDGWQNQLETFTEEDWKQVSVTKETLIQILEFLSKK